MRVASWNYLKQTATLTQLISKHIDTASVISITVSNTGKTAIRICPCCSVVEVSF